MQSYHYQINLADVDWDDLKAILVADNFDNGRSPEQLRLSFQNSAFCVIVQDDRRIIATARVLSDGICNAYLVDVWTHSNFRGRGIATNMIKLLENHLSGQHIYLQTDDRVTFYQQLGYKKQPFGMSKVVGNWLEN